MMKKQTKLKATHEGKIKIGQTILDVAVLNDKTRIISQSDLFKAFGRPMRGSRDTSDQHLRQNPENASKLPALIDAKNLKPFISSDLMDVIKVVEYENLSGEICRGYDAIILPLICEVYITANEAKKHDGKPVLLAKQVANYVASKMLMRSLYKISIISLVDEATSFQYERAKDALQKFLDKFLLEERAKWIKTFPDEFFETIYKMKGWNWSEAASGQKPGVIGHYINDLIYSRIAPEVLRELQARNPVTEKGYRKYKHPQLIDPEFGHPKLKEHINSITLLGRASGYNWNAFQKLVNKAFPPFGKSLEMDFPED